MSAIWGTTALPIHSADAEVATNIIRDVMNPLNRLSVLRPERRAQSPRSGTGSGCRDNFGSVKGLGRRRGADTKAHQHCRDGESIRHNDGTIDKLRARPNLCIQDEVINNRHLKF
jgi:hypothetical protein